MSTQSGKVTAYRFAMVPEEVLYAPVSDRAVRLFAVLARHADDERRAFPGRRRLAELLDCALSTVDAALAELVKAGFVRVEGQVRADGSRSANSYWLLPFTTDAPTDTPVPPSRHAGRGVPTSREGSPAPPVGGPTDTPVGVYRGIGQQEEREPDKESQKEREPENNPPLPPSGGARGAEVDPESPEGLEAAKGKGSAYGFDRWWSLYPARSNQKGHKGKAQALWAKQTYVQKSEAWRQLKDYVKVVADGHPPMAAERWLRRIRDQKWDPAEGWQHDPNERRRERHMSSSDRTGQAAARRALYEDVMGGDGGRPDDQGAVAVHGRDVAELPAP